MVDFSGPLLDWYDKNKRPLPWREDTNPYRVWVSEIMLQQTRIEAARDYFTRFMAALPTVEALAAAEEDRVLKLWEGLGYYSRARNLHACAKVLISEHGGAFPQDVRALRSLPGIGDYTAGAIASIAFGLPEPAVDGNVVRLLARLTRYTAVTGERTKAAFREELRRIYPMGRCGDFTAGLMELGEVVCVPGAPRCSQCPLARLCLAHRAGEERDYPRLPEKRPRRVEERRVLVLRCGDKLAVRRRPERGLLARLWELPNDLERDAPPEAEPLGEASHIFTHVEWHMRGYLLDLAQEDPAFTWVTGSERAALAMPTAFRYYIKKLEEMGL